MDTFLYQDLYDLEDSHWWHRNKRLVVLECLRMFVMQTKPIIIDIGCGTGKNVETFSTIGTVYGLDSSNEALRFCRKRGLRRVMKGDAERTGLSETFDVVTLLDVLEHTDDKKTIHEIHRILKTKGVLIITVPAYQWLWSKWDEVLHHRRRYSADHLLSLLTENGFSIEYITFLYPWLLIPIVFVRVVKNIFRRTEYGSDFTLNLPVLNQVIQGICAIERMWLRYGTIPFGTSILCVARKR